MNALDFIISQNLVLEGKRTKKNFTLFNGWEENTDKYILDENGIKVIRYKNNGEPVGSVNYSWNEKSILNKNSKKKQSYRKRKLLLRK